MSRTRAQYVCEECGWSTTKWVGRCGECQEWGSVKETVASTGATAVTQVAAPALPIEQVPADAAVFMPTGVGGVRSGAGRGHGARGGGAPRR